MPGRPRYDAARVNAQTELAAALEQHRKGQFDPAETAYRTILAANPRDANALHLLGLLLHQRGRSNEGADLIRQAILIQPNVPAFYSNLGEALRAADRLEEAIDAHIRGVRLKPDFYEGIHNLGGAFGQANRVTDAIACYREAIRLRPDDPEPHWNLAVALLVSGDLANGFREFEWRLQRPLTRGRPYQRPRWIGEQLSGKTLLLWSEQGFGDVIQFSRYLPLVKERSGARVILDVHPELVDLLKQQQLADEVVPAHGKAPPAFDAHAPLMSVPYILASTLETLPRTVPYLAPPASRVGEWAALLPSDGSKKVGIAWAGRPTHHNDRRRSMPPALLSALGDVKGVTFVTVQPRGATTAPPADLPLLDLGPRLRDFGDTAALLSQLDLLISVDTAVVHLAGALARPVWTMLPFAPDWRWLLDREDTPWYPTMRLFRQRRVGVWNDVIERVRGELAQFSAT